MIVRTCSRVAVLLALVAPGLAGAQATDDAPATPSDEPRPTPLVEETGRRLVQIDVSVDGPPEAVLDLTADDFEVKLGFKKIRSFTVDRACDEGTVRARSQKRKREPLAPPRPTPGARQASYVFYLDLQHLTARGRQRTFDMVREMIPRLVRNGDHGMLVANARRLETPASFTDDPAVLLEAVDEVEQDPAFWDFYSIQEEQRVNDVIEELNSSLDLNRTILRARWHQQEERWRTEKNLRRLESVVARLVELDPPKAVVYFADTMRSNAGEHYLSFFHEMVSQGDSTLSAISHDALTSALAFDRVVNQASAEGTRFYSVFGEGLVTFGNSSLPSFRGVERVTAQPNFSSRTRFVHAQNTLGSLSAETGGRAYLHGAKASQIADEIITDFSCLYLISFDPEGYWLDTPHRVVVNVNRPGVTARSRGRVVLQSDSARLSARLAGAFSAPEDDPGDLTLTSHLVPIGFRDGSYRALLQITSPGIPLAGTTWELGASLVSRDRVRGEASGKLSVSGPGVPVILEHEMTFPPGAFEVVAVAHETRTDVVASGQHAGEWADPGKGAASVGPIALLQPQSGAFLRDGDVRTSGPVARPPEAWIRADLPTALVGLVCRGRSRKQTLRVERALEGSSTVEFDPIELDLGQDVCAQVRDVIPEGTMGPGSYSYHVRVLRDGEPVDAEERVFRVGDPG